MQKSPAPDEVAEPAAVDTAAELPPEMEELGIVPSPSMPEVGSGSAVADYAEPEVVEEEAEAAAAEAVAH